jgi:hypothetical protein
LDMNTESTTEASVNDNSKAIADATSSSLGNRLAMPAKKTAVAAKAKAAPTSKIRNRVQRKARSKRTATKADKLVCRYCGSDDLAPSFKKRRDARCRACFKKRYGSSARGRTAKRLRKTKTAM